MKKFWKEYSETFWVVTMMLGCLCGLFFVQASRNEKAEKKPSTLTIPK